MPVKVYVAPLMASGQLKVPDMRFGGLPETVPTMLHPPPLLKEIAEPFTWPPVQLEPARLDDCEVPAIEQSWLPLTAVPGLSKVDDNTLSRAGRGQLRVADIQIQRPGPGDIWRPARSRRIARTCDARKNCDEPYNHEATMTAHHTLHGSL